MYLLFMVIRDNMVLQQHNDVIIGIKLREDEVTDNLQMHFYKEMKRKILATNRFIEHFPLQLIKKR